LSPGDKRVLGCPLGVPHIKCKPLGRGREAGRVPEIVALQSDLCLGRGIVPLATVSSALRDYVEALGAWGHVGLGRARPPRALRERGALATTPEASPFAGPTVLVPTMSRTRPNAPRMVAPPSHAAQRFRVRLNLGTPMRGPHHVDPDLNQALDRDPDTDPNTDPDRDRDPQPTPIPRPKPRRPRRRLTT
jgi:hypothetical protein